MKKLVIALIAGLAFSLTACSSTPSTVDSSTSVVEDTTTTEVTPEPAPVTSRFTRSENNYLVAVHSVDNSFVESNTDEDLVKIGHLVCDALDEGNTVSDIVEYFDNTGDYDTTVKQEYLAAVVAGAVTKMCPEYKYQFDELN